MPSKIVKVRGGLWRIFEEPQGGCHYSIGCDTASGKDGSNDSAAQILNIETGHQAAVLNGQIDPSTMCGEMLKAGLAYNKATILVEVEFHGKTVINGLYDAGYENLFIHQENLIGSSDGQRDFGWQPQKYRQLAVDWLVTAVGYSTSFKKQELEKAIFLHDPATISQMGYFIRHNKTGKMQAAYGKKDDLVSALYIANFGRVVLRESLKPVVEPEPYRETWNDLLSRKREETDDDRSMSFGDDERT